MSRKNPPRMSRNAPAKKHRRRGNRLIVTEGDVTATFMKDRHGNMVCVERVSSGKYSHLVMHSPSGRYEIRRMRGDDTFCDWLVVGSRDRGPIGMKAADSPNSPWFFFLEDGKIYVPLSHTGIHNAALNMSVAADVAEGLLDLEAELAAFLDVSPRLCRYERAVEIFNDPRFAVLKSQEFEMRPPPRRILEGRSSPQNKFRHEYTNYDVLRKPGGRFMQDKGVFQQFRKGVDVLVDEGLARTGNRTTAAGSDWDPHGGAAGTKGSLTWKLDGLGSRLAAALNTDTDRKGRRVPGRIIRHSRCTQYVMTRVICANYPDQLAVLAPARDSTVVVCLKEAFAVDGPWRFHFGDVVYVSLPRTTTLEGATKASRATRRIDDNLAAFLGISVWVGEAGPATVPTGLSGRGSASVPRRGWNLHLLTAAVTLAGRSAGSSSGARAAPAAGRSAGHGLGGV